MREMRLSKREIREQEQLCRVIENCDVVRIGTMDQEGIFIVPVNFGYEMKEQGGETPCLRLYFHSAKEGRKVDAFRENTRVAVEMDCAHELIRGDYSCSYSYAYTSIMGSGVVRLVTEKEEKLRGLRLLMEHMEASKEAAFREDMVERVHVYCIEVDTFTGKTRMPK